MSKLLRRLLRALTSGTIISGDRPFRNPNRVMHVKFNLTARQAARLRKLGPRKHTLVRDLLNTHFAGEDLYKADLKAEKDAHKAACAAG